MEQNFNRFESLLRCRTPQDLAAVQSEFLRDNLESFLQYITASMNSQISVRLARRAPWPPPHRMKSPASSVRRYPALRLDRSAWPSDLTTVTLPGDRKNAQAAFAGTGIAIQS